MLFYESSVYPTKYHILLLNSFPSDWYVIPLLLSGTLTSPWAPFQRVDDEKTRKKRRFFSHCLLLAAILARWWCLVAFYKALNLLHWAMCAVLYRRIPMAIDSATFLGAFVDCCLFACCPGGRWGDMEWVVARCRRPVASGVALDIPHWAMLSVLLRRTAVAIKTAGGRGAFFCHHCLVCINMHSYKTMLWSIKTKNNKLT